MTTIASFDVDAQKGFTPLCPNDLPVNEGDQIVNELNKQATLSNYRVGSKDAHSAGAKWETTAELPIFSPVGLPNVDIRWPRHCVVGTEGGQLLDGLPKETDYDFFVWKGIEQDLHPYGACYHDLNNKLSTGVIEFLREKSVSKVIVGGLATDYCVATTATQLHNAGFKVIINLAACRGVSSDTSENAVNKMKAMGILIAKDADEVKELLK
jgi:nicotinamidase/pyrazinamidase